MSIDQLPKTICHSVELVRELGLRYLWIDRLCIIRDENVSLRAQIRTMDGIYTQSTFLIIARDRVEAEAGLLCMRSVRDYQ